MLIIGIDPGISGAICFLKNGKIVDAIEMPSMAEGKKNKKQVNSSQIFNEISSKIKNYNKVFVGYNLRYHPVVDKLKKLIKKNLKEN